MRATVPSRLCDHCLLPLADHDAIRADFPDGERMFCCTACRSIYRMIREEGLQDFYRTREWKTAGIAGAIRAQESSEGGEDAAEEERLMPLIREEGTAREAELLIDGIRCASCVWLIEKVLERTPGVFGARVNFATHAAHVRWDGARTSLGGILDRLRSIGYLGRPYSPEARENALRKENRDLLVRFGTAAFFSMQLMLISFGLYAGFFQGIDPRSKQALSLAAFLVATPVLFYSGRPFLGAAFRGLRNRVLNMDALITLGASSAYFLSVRNMLAGGEVYFDTSAMIITLILLGRYLESSTRQKASHAVTRLLALQPQEARLVRGRESVMVPVPSLRKGDHIEVRPGERVPLDGKVTEGRSEIDESLMTGESRPVEKTAGSDVIGGTVNGPGALFIEVTNTGRDTFVARVVKLVESAQAAPAPIQRVADRVSAWFIPFVLLAGTCTWWYWAGRVPGPEALLNGVAVLVIACPCALGLATPVAVLAGIGNAAKRGILIKGGDVLERMHSIDTVILDKTGTITTGKMEVVGLRVGDHGSRIDKSELLQYAASVEQRSEHLAGSAIVRYAKDRGVTLLDIRDFEAKPGRGVLASIQGSRVLVGTRRFLEENDIPTGQGTIAGEEEPAGQGNTVVWAAKDGNPLGCIILKDVPKPDARETIGRLRSLRIDTVMITGDDPDTARSIAAETGIQRVVAGVLPEGKVEKIAGLRKDGRIVAMVGDGINDAPALAAADVGLAMASGTDIAAETASVVLLRPELMSVAQAIDLSKKSFRIVRQNLFWAFAYNVAAIPLATAGVLSPIVAAAAMAASSVTVVMNSLRSR